MSTNKFLYNTCFTRNNDGTHVLVEIDTGELCITGMTEDTFWDRKVYNELKRTRVAKKGEFKHEKRQKSKKDVPL